MRAALLHRRARINLALVLCTTLATAIEYAARNCAGVDDPPHNCAHSLSQVWPADANGLAVPREGAPRHQ